MNTNDLLNVARALNFKMSTLKQKQFINVYNPDSIALSAYGINQNVCVCISNHRTNIVTWINEFKDNLPLIGISLVFLCTNKKLNEYEGNFQIKKEIYEKYKPQLDKFIIYEYVFDFTKFKFEEDSQTLVQEIHTTLNNKRFSINPQLQKTYFSPIIVDGQKRKKITPIIIESHTPTNSKIQLYEY